MAISDEGKIVVPLASCKAVLPNLSPSTHYKVILRDVESKTFAYCDLTTLCEFACCIAQNIITFTIIHVVVNKLFSYPCRLFN